MEGESNICFSSSFENEIVLMMNIFRSLNDPVNERKGMWIIETYMKFQEGTQHIFRYENGRRLKIRKEGESIQL